MAMLRVRNNEVLDNRAKLIHHPSTYKIPWEDWESEIKKLEISKNFSKLEGKAVNRKGSLSIRSFFYLLFYDLSLTLNVASCL